MTRVGWLAAGAAALTAAVVLVPALVFGSDAGYAAAFPWIAFVFFIIGDRQFPIHQEAAIVALLGAVGWGLSVAAVGWLIVLVRAKRRSRP